MFLVVKSACVRIFRRTDAFLYLDRLKLFFQASSGVTTSLENEFVRVIHKYSTDARRNAPLREWWWRLKIDTVIVCVGFGV